MKLLLYCTKSKPYLFESISEKGKYMLENNEWFKELNGKIVAECDFEVEDLRIVEDDPLGAYWYETKTLCENEVLEKSCLTSDEVYEYLGDYNEGYAIHIKNLHIFDEPKELSEYKRKDEFMGGKQIFWETIKKAPQNMMYAYKYNFIKGKLDKYILISIKPEWLCKILNGEKTIEVRKKVLKEMIK